MIFCFLFGTALYLTKVRLTIYTNVIEVITKISKPTKKNTAESLKYISQTNVKKHEKNTGLTKFCITLKAAFL